MGDRLKLIGTHVARYGLVIVLLWIGGMKFTAYEAEGIRPLVANSPLMGWVYRAVSVDRFSSMLGAIEIAVGLLIALRPVWPMGTRPGPEVRPDPERCRILYENRGRTSPPMHDQADIFMAPGATTTAT